MIPLPICLAPAERATSEVLRGQRDKLALPVPVDSLLDSFPEGAVVLNAHRQIVLANDKLAAFLNQPRDALVGLRLGEALGCGHASDEPGGCGTSEACRACGAAKAIEASRLNRSREVRECRVLRAVRSGSLSLDLKVWATPVVYGGEAFTILAVRDTSDENRRRHLELIFFHDVLNLAGGIRGALELLPDLPPEEAAEVGLLAAAQARRLVEEIECQRSLAAAERGDLAVQACRVSVQEVLAGIQFVYHHHPAGEGKALAVAECDGAAALHTDPTLLDRVLGNLVKNALEASGPGEVVKVWHEAVPGGHAFFVNNPAVLSDSVRGQMFQRSFSTKGAPGRGLGTYSVKLLTERYLRGRVFFDSSPGRGTTFRVELPGPSGRGERAPGTTE